MVLWRKGRIEASYSTLIIAIVVLLAAAGVIYVYNTLIGQSPFLNPEEVGWSTVFVVWFIGAAMAGLIVVIIQRLRS
ncbi:MAG: hypothetical protein ACTSW4_01800, partial [Candidatus Ranarchaeia archaeon]